MARTKHVRSTADLGRDFPSLVPPLHLLPGQIVKVERHVHLTDVETVTAKDYQAQDEGLVTDITYAMPDADLVDEDGSVVVPETRDFSLAGTDEALAHPPSQFEQPSDTALPAAEDGDEDDSDEPPVQDSPPTA